MLVLGHVFGIPVEETLLTFAPAAGLAFAVAAYGARARLRDVQRWSHRLREFWAKRFLSSD
jgi:hypothetical protein